MHDDVENLDRLIDEPRPARTINAFAREAEIWCIGATARGRFKRLKQQADTLLDKLVEEGAQERVDVCPDWGANKCRH